MRRYRRGLPASGLLLGAAMALVAPAHAAPSGPCGATPLGSADELVHCIRIDPLLSDLDVLQRISDENPGADGHGNRDTGTTGYKASVDYVAGRMRHAGYSVKIQAYPLNAFQVQGSPRLASEGHEFALGTDWHVARLSASGKVRAGVQRAGDALHRGCAPADFAGFVAGRIALVESGGCALDDKVAQAESAGAAALIVYNGAATEARPEAKGEPGNGVAFEGHLRREAAIPVVGVASNAVGLELQRPLPSGQARSVQLEIDARITPGTTDYNVIAESPYGDPSSVVVVEGHLDSIFGAGILDNGSGSATILEIALAMASTPTLHRLRYIWFGGEEIGLWGSRWYTQNLSKGELAKIDFDIDADVTATPNYAILVADPGHSNDVQRFPPNVVPESQRGNRYFTDFFSSIGVPSKMASFGNDGTDSNSFSLVGIPNTGVLTEQDCCKSRGQVRVWGGYTGNYEGNIPSHDGGCVDRSHRWCDNIDNIRPDVFEFVSQSVAYVTYRLANDPDVGSGRR